MRVKPSEHDVQSTILSYLTLHRVWHRRINTGAFAGEYRGKRRFVRFGKKGDPDILAYWDTHLIAIECKAESGKLTAEQEAFRADFEAHGGTYVVARKLEDVSDIIETLRAFALIGAEK